MIRGQLERVLREPEHLEARGAMLLGAHLAGLAIEGSMLRWRRTPAPTR